IIHIIALARRAGCVEIGLEDFDRLSRKVPVLANIRPNGDSQYLMEDFYYAGGLPALMQRLSAFLQLDAITVSGQTIGGNIKDAQVYNDDVIRSAEAAVYKEGSLAVLKGNLAPDG